MSWHREAGSARMLNLSQEMLDLPEKTRNFPISHIYNTDETGFFFRLVSRPCYVLLAEGKRFLRGTKATSAKDRVTSFICTSADKFDKVGLAIVGKARNPRWFVQKALKLRTSTKKVRGMTL